MSWFYHLSPNYTISFSHRIHLQWALFTAVSYYLSTFHYTVNSNTHTRTLTIHIRSHAIGCMVYVVYIAYENRSKCRMMVKMGKSSAFFLDCRLKFHVFSIITRSLANHHANECRCKVTGLTNHYSKYTLKSLHSM